MRAARAARAAAAILFAVGLLGAPAASAATPGLVGAYGFEEASGTAIVDASAAGNAGAIAGATRSPAGRFGAALSFDGVNDVVNVADASSLDLSPAMTLEAWVKPSATGWRTAILKERPGGLAYGLYASTDSNRPSSELALPGSVDTRGAAALPVNAWSHLASTYDGATLRLYVGGTQVASRAASGSITVSSGSLQIGGNAVWGEYFKGLIDEVRIYNRALTAAEIQADMSAPVAGTGGPSATTGLAASYAGSRITLTWDGASDDVDVTGYVVYRSKTSGFTPTAAERLATVAASPRSFADTPPEIATYYYRVAAVDADGNVGPPSAQASATVNSSRPSPPPNLTATSFDGAIELAWDAPQSEHAIAEYRIHRSSDPGFAPDAANLVGTSTDRTFTDANPPAGSVSYRVTSVNIYGQVSSTSTLVTTGVEADTTPPVVTITGGCPASPLHDYIQVRAQASDDRQVASLEFRVDGVRVGAPGTSVITREWESRTVANGPHVFSFVARDSAGNETTKSCDVEVHNPLVTVDFPSPADGAMVSGVVTIAVETRADGVLLTGFGDWSGTGVTISPTGAAVGNNFAATRTWDTTKVPNGTYTIAGRAYWMDYGAPRASKTIQVTVDNPSSIGAPTGLAAEEHSTGVRLNWAAVAGASAYRVYRGSDLAAETAETSAADLRLTPGTYSYKVRGVDAAGAEGPAATLEVTHTEDETGPVVTLVAACDGRTLSEYVGPIDGRATDDRGGDVRIEVSVDDTRIFGPSTGASGSGFRFDWDTRQFADGSHAMRVLATDDWGNETVFDCPWTVDNRELTVAIGTPASPLAGTVADDFQPKADGAAVSTPVQLLVDGVVVKDGFGPYTYDWDTTEVANGSHTLEARLYWAGYPAPLVTSTRTATVQNAAPPALSGLVAAYGFEEAAGTAVADASPNAFTGTISGASRSTAGRFGGALSFDGVNDLVTVPDAGALDVTTAMTLSAWVRPTVLRGWRTVVFKTRPGGLAYGLYANTDANRPSGMIQTSGEQQASGTAQLAPDAWTHLAVTYDSLAVRLYVDGAPAATRPVTAPITVSTGALTIGGNTIWSEWFKGLIDEVRVYDRALGPAEVAADRDRGVAG